MKLPFPFIQISLLYAIWLRNFVNVDKIKGEFYFRGVLQTLYEKCRKFKTILKALFLTATTYNMRNR